MKEERVIIHFFSAAFNITSLLLHPSVFFSLSTILPFLSYIPFIFSYSLLCFSPTIFMLSFPISPTYSVFFCLCFASFPLSPVLSHIIYHVCSPFLPPPFYPPRCLFSSPSSPPSPKITFQTSFICMKGRKCTLPKQRNILCVCNLVP